MDLLLDIDEIIKKKPIEEVSKNVDNSKLYSEEIKKIIRKSVNSLLKGQKYQHNNIKTLQTQLVDLILNKLTLLKLPIMMEAVKYIVTCTIMQMGSNGFHTASASFVDEVLDRHVLLNLQDDEFFISVNVFSLAV